MVESAVLKSTEVSDCQELQKFSNLLEFKSFKYHTNILIFLGLE